MGELGGVNNLWVSFLFLKKEINSITSFDFGVPLANNLLIAEFSIRYLCLL